MPDTPLSDFQPPSSASADPDLVGPAVGRFPPAAAAGARGDGRGLSGRAVPARSAAWPSRSSSRSWPAIAPICSGSSARPRPPPRWSMPTSCRSTRSGCVDQLHYIAQEYVQGQNLREWIARHGPPDLPHALSIMRQVAAALAKAAEQGVVHRDIKPENIMLTAGGEVKVADFGLARARPRRRRQRPDPGRHHAGHAAVHEPRAGRRQAARPAQRHLFVRRDLLPHAQPARRRFSGETALGVAVQHLKKQPQPLETLRPDLPPALCRIVHQMLAKDPAQRFAIGPRTAPRAAPRAGRALRRRLARGPARLGIAGRRADRPIRASRPRSSSTALMKTVGRSRAAAAVAAGRWRRRWRRPLRWAASRRG